MTKEFTERGKYIGSVIKLYRKKRGLTIKNLADLSGVSIATINRTEKGILPSDITLEAILLPLNLSVSYTITDLDTKEPVRQFSTRDKDLVRTRRF